MIDIDDLWIGDTVILIKSGRIGKYEGLGKNNKLRINIGHKIVISTISNIAPYTPAERDIVKEFTKKHLSVEKPTAKKVGRQTILDLHIEVLNPNLKNQRPERIVQVQIDAAKSFIENAISKNYHSIQIIHGKGLGVLKSEIIHLLSLYDEVKISVPINDGGATEVLFIPR